MNKKNIKKILKELKKNNEITISYCPTLEECDYLFSNGVNVTMVNSNRRCLLDNKITYLVKSYKFSNEVILWDKEERFIY